MSYIEYIQIFITLVLGLAFTRIIILIILLIGVFSKQELIQKCVAVLFFLMAIAWFLSENTI